MNTKKTKKEMLKCFDEMCLFMSNHGFTERDERAIQIRELIQQEIIVKREEIESAIYAGRNWDDGKFYDKDGIQAVIELFKSKGFVIMEQ